MSAHAYRPPAPANSTSANFLQTNPLELTGRPILLATDGSEGAIAGAQVARGLAATHGARVHVVSVVDTRPAPIPPPLDRALAIGDALTSPALHEEQARQVRASLSAGTESTIDWPVRVMLGSPSSAIVEEARHIGAALIVVGLRRHGRMERVVHDETALDVMRHAPCPVLGVVPSTTALPTRVLAAVDFSESSLRATRAARGLVGDGAVMVLAYVPPVTPFAPDDGERLIHELGVEAGFARIAQELGEEGITFDHVVLHRARAGSAADLLLEYAEGASIDLIAAGSARHTRVERWIVGSVSEALVRDGRRSVLIVPPWSQRPR